MTLRRIAAAIFGKISPRIQRHAAAVAILGSVIILFTVVVKDNLAEGIRSHIQAVEIAKQFYMVHIEDIDLTMQMKEIGESIEELKREQTNKKFSSGLRETAAKATDGINQAVKMAKLTDAIDANTEELMKHVGDSDPFFLWAETDAQITRDSVTISRKALKMLIADIQESNNELNSAYKMALDPNHSFTPEKLLKAFDGAEDKASRAAIQGYNLSDMARSEQLRAVKAAESYREYLETQDRVCNWVIIVLVVAGTTLGLLGQLSGVRSAEVKAS